MPPPEPVIAPNLGLYLDRPSFSIPSRGLEDCLNVRILRGSLSSFNMGWEKFTTEALNGPVTMIDQFFKADGNSFLIAGTFRDLYRFNTGPGEWLFITPVYNTGTVTTTGASSTVTGSGTAWNTAATNRTGNNVQVGDEIYLHTTGNNAQNDPSPAVGAWFPIVGVASDTSLTVTGTPPAITTQTYTIRQRFNSGNLNNYWRSEVFPRGDVAATIGDRWYATNFVDDIVRWDGSATFASRIHTGASGFRCRFMRRFKNMMLYFNIVENSGAVPNKPQSMKNSDVGKPETMTGGLAGEFIVAPSVAELVSVGAIGDDVAAFTTREIVSITFLGSPDIFAFRTAVSGTGLIAGRLVGEFADGVQFIGNDAAYEFNGVQAEQIDSHVWIRVLRQQDTNRIEASHSIFDEENGTLIWAIAQASDSGTTANGTPPNIAYQSHYLEDVGRAPTPYTRREFPFTAAGFFQRDDALTWDELTGPWTDYNFAWGDRILAAAFPLVLAGDINGQIYTLFTVDSKNGAALTSYALFGKRFISDYRHRNLIWRVYPFTQELPTATYTLTTTTSVYDKPDGVGTHQIDEYSMAPNSQHFISPRVRGRLAQLQFGTAGAPTVGGQPWRLDGYDWDIRQGGQR